MTSSGRLALVTGATGYIGGLLVPLLLADGWRVRVVTRDAVGLQGRHWRDDVDVVEGDVHDVATLDAALDGTDVAYYLVHSMSQSHDYARLDRELASTFGAAARRAGTSRIVYLGGLHPLDEPLSEHLASRKEVGEILLASKVPTAALQAGMVMGQGSASFDLLHVSSRLPAIVAPTWLDNHVQPITAADALHYLVGAADLPADVNRTFDVGGPDVVTYRELIVAYARAAGRRPPPVLTVPILLPRTASLWAGLVTPGSSTLNSALVHSLTLDMVCHEHDIAQHVPDPEGGLTGVTEALTAALRAG